GRAVEGGDPRALAARRPADVGRAGIRVPVLAHSVPLRSDGREAANDRARRAGHCGDGLPGPARAAFRRRGPRRDWERRARPRARTRRGRVDRARTEGDRLRRRRDRSARLSHGKSQRGTASSGFLARHSSELPNGLTPPSLNHMPSTNNSALSAAFTGAAGIEISDVAAGAAARPRARCRHRRASIGRNSAALVYVTRTTSNPADVSRRESDAREYRRRSWLRIE